MQPKRWRFPILLAAVVLVVTACAQPATQPAGSTAPPGGPTSAAKPAPAGDLKSLRGVVKIDGSSTVFPISEAMAEEFQKATAGNVKVTVGISGTGGGFKKFCNDETDISGASRPIRQSEIDACKQNNVQWIELPVAFDGLSVIVSPQNTFVDSMTVAELKTLWEPDAQGKITRWSQIRPGWPDRPFRLYGPGTDSGTFDYFTEAINGKEKASRGDYTASEDDNVLVQGVANDPDALGYFGFAYYIENKDKLKLVKIDAGKGNGPVAPSTETINDGSYQPLSRPLFIYVKLSSLDRPEVREFVRYYLDPKNAEQLVPQVGYAPLPEKTYTLGLQRFEAKQVGTVFGGKVAEGVKVDDLFAKAPAIP